VQNDFRQPSIGKFLQVGRSRRDRRWVDFWDEIFQWNPHFYLIFQTKQPQ
jgi:hypothetical protein